MEAAKKLPLLLYNSLHLPVNRHAILAVCIEHSSGDNAFSLGPVKVGGKDMQFAVLKLEEFSIASHFFRAISQAPATASCFLTVGRQLAELKVTAFNLRQLIPIPEIEKPYMNRVADLTAYHVWFAGLHIDPVCLGVFDVPPFRHGELYVTFDPKNVNDSGKPLHKYRWLLITAGGEQEIGTWRADASTAVLYGRIPQTKKFQGNSRPPWELFTERKANCADIYGVGEFDEDDYDEFDSLSIIE